MDSDVCLQMGRFQIGFATVAVSANKRAFTLIRDFSRQGDGLMARSKRSQGGSGSDRGKFLVELIGLQRLQQVGGWKDFMEASRGQFGGYHSTVIHVDQV